MLLHGFVDTWRTWELVLPALEQRHEVLAPTLPGHAGGPPLGDELTPEVLADGVERAMDEAGFEMAHVAGNSLGGYVALQLASRGRATSVVALAPAGGWAEGDLSFRATLEQQERLVGMLEGAAQYADLIVATPAGRRQVTSLIVERHEHIPPDLLAHLIRGAAGCTGAVAMLRYAAEHGWPLLPERIDCPVRVVWGTEDRLLPWPRSAARFQNQWLPHADWVELDGVGHCPQLDVPLETAQLILGFTAP